MTKINYFYFLSIFLTSTLCYDLDDIKTKTNPTTQSNAVLELIQRIIPDRAEDFIVEVNPNLMLNGKELFHIESVTSDKIKISGTTGVVAATGFNYYLKYYLNSHVSWEISQLNVPKVFPKINLTNTLNDKLRYYQNVCTTSYSFVWWNWKNWEKHIDWMAMNSFNLVLAFNGQEAIWKRIYEKLNLTRSEIDDQFTGPAFLSWERMGNIKKWGGPLSQEFHQNSLTLQKQIITRMRNLGIIPILPAFSGYVPKAIKRIYPSINITSMKWNQFNEDYQASLLDPFDHHFQEIGDLYMYEMIKEFGTDHVYSADTFNEIIPPTTNLDYIKRAGEAVYEAMIYTDPKAIWVMQNWLFVNAFLYWTPNRAKALLTSIPIGKMIVLDLQSEQYPQYDRFQSYFGQPFIWCMLHNFGGTLGMFGSPQIINQKSFDARRKNGSTMVGTGLTPEGIFQNYVIYELMAEMAFRQNPVDLNLWFKNYAVRRYGKFNEDATQSWMLLLSSVYNFQGLQRVRGKYTMNISPSTRITINYWYNPCDVYQAWNNLLKASDDFKDNPGYKHDLVDLTRQVIQLIGDNMYKEIIFVYKRKDTESFNNSISTFLTLFDDLDDILATNENFLLGSWINAAKNASNSYNESKLFEFNARNQITLWGPNGEIKDYASKQWSGMVKDYFKPRWNYFLTAMLKALETKTPFDQNGVRAKIFKEIEQPFSFDTKSYPEIPFGNTVEVAKRIYNKWWSQINC
ncbi:alpha-N-acetylglucosaminidase [Onthophagus taurus]|uniref:alpha-N-acetylglucosaminidase n=1 Tax=Onthophagus taurus TaxID=166361 RepID=UPI0039BE8F61